MEDNVQSVLSEMWEEACENGRVVSFRIASGSMRPAIEVEDVVQVRRVEPSEIHAGDIVAFKNRGRIIVHRIVRIDRSNGSLGFFQMGDVGGVSKSLKEKNILGKVTVVNKKGRDFRLDSRRQIIANRIFGCRALLIDYVNRGQHQGIKTGLKFFVRPVWRLFRRLLLWHS